MKNITNSLVFSYKVFPIALILLMLSLHVYSFNYKAYRTDTAPAIDGVANEDCWKTAAWAYINQPFDGKTSIPDSADFYGRYKMVWNASGLYVLMEITDDKLVDLRANPRDTYWEDDCVEFFIDEDHMPEGHECGNNAFNALAYHIAVVPRNKNNYDFGSIMPFDSPDAINHVIDLGTDCYTYNALNLDDHVNIKIVKEGNKYTWELGFKVFDKNYNQNSANNTPVTLTPDKVMGFAIAYCDDDSGVRDKMIGTIPEHNDYNGPYPFYRFTNELGTLTLNDSVLLSNTANIESENLMKNDFLNPNPVKNTLNIKNAEDNNQSGQMAIHNMAGLQMVSKRFEPYNTAIDVSWLPAGGYVMQISGREFLCKQLFVKV